MIADSTRPTERARAALDEVFALRAAVAREGRAAFRLWEGRIERPAFAPSALMRTNRWMPASLAALITFRVPSTITRSKSARRPLMIATRWTT